VRQVHDRRGRRRRRCHQRQHSLFFISPGVPEFSSE
jgi:hypothetical protein